MKRWLQIAFLVGLSLIGARASFAQGGFASGISWRYTPAGAFPYGAATVTVCTASATGAPCTPTVSVFADAGLSMSVANPLAQCSTSPQVGCIDNLGNFSFYATPGTYTYTITGAGIVPYGPIPITTTAGLLTIINGTYYVGVPGGAYACTAAGINQAIIDSIAASVASGSTRIGAKVDASACSGNITMTSQINVGNSSQQSMTLILPNGANWSFNMAGGTSCGILQYGGTTIIGPTLGGGSLAARMQIQPAMGSDLFATYCTRFAQTAVTADEGYFNASGFFISDNNVTTASGYTAMFFGMFDDSQIEQVQVGSTANNGGWVNATCCGTSFIGVTWNNVNTGGIPLTIGPNGTAPAVNTKDTSFINNSVDHPLSTKPNILIQQGSTGGVILGIHFINLYGEGTIGTNISAPTVEIGQNAEDISFFGGSLNSEMASGFNQPCIQLDSNASSAANLLIENLDCINYQSATAVINDLRTGNYGNYNGRNVAVNVNLIHSYLSGQVFLAPSPGSPAPLAAVLYSGTGSDPTSVLAGSLHYRSDLNRYRWADGSAYHSIVGADTTDTFTNKTLTSPTINNPTLNGTSVTGTPASANLAATIASGTTTLTSGNIANATCQAVVTTSASGVLTTDGIEWAYATNPTVTTDGLLTVSASVTSNNVNFTRCNDTATNPIASTGIVINWRVLR